jgi:hypothetical protein
MKPYIHCIRYVCQLTGSMLVPPSVWKGAGRLPVPPLIPQPRSIVELAGPGPAALSALVADRLPEPFAEQAEPIAAALASDSRASRLALPVRFAIGDAPEQGYRLRLRKDRAEIQAGDGLGALHGARTLASLAGAGEPAMPALEITDSPSFPRRGVYLESTRGTDLMELDDWRALLDGLAALKLTTVGISLYGCWDLRHDSERTEFLLVPLRDFPTLRTPRTVTTWDRVAGGQVRRSHLPRMFELDFFADVARHARARGLEVIPFFAGPSHSTLVPRLLPALSAKDPDGRPVGYGYCVSDPAARDLLARLLDNLAWQHLRPNGVAMLGCGADEYYAIRNLRPDEPGALIDPRCRCAGCDHLSLGEQLVAYLVLAAEVLDRHGIRLVHWHDSLVREGVLAGYRRALDARRLPSPTLAWWRYSFPLPEPDTSLFEAWVSPTIGLVASLFLTDTTSNIEAWLRSGGRRGASGVLAYGVAHPVLQRNIACLADLAWNLEGSGGALGFGQRWSRYVAGDRADEAQLAYTVGGTVLGSNPLVLHLLDHGLPYFALSMRDGVEFPGDLLAALAVRTPALTTLLAQCRDALRAATAAMPPTRGPTPLCDEATVWRAETGRAADHLDLVLGAVALAREARDLPRDVYEERVGGLERATRELLDRIQVVVPYQEPYVLREHLAFLRGLRAAIAGAAARIPGEAAYHPWEL